MIVAVLGAGALGTLVAASLAIECEVCLLAHDRRAARAIANRGGINVVGETIRHVRVACDPDVVRGAALLVVAVKTYATIDALAPLHAALSHDATIVSLQNGIDAASYVEFALGYRSRIALAPTTEAATWLEPGIVRRTAIGTTHIGWANGHDPGFEPHAIAELFTRCGIRTILASPIERYLWAKLVVNAAINPVTALAGVSNGEVLKRPELRERAALLAREAFAVARAEGITLPFGDPVVEAERVMTLTAANRSSMLQDLDRHRPTEIDAISGAILRRAAKHGITARATQSILDDLRARTKM